MSFRSIVKFIIIAGAYYFSSKLGLLFNIPPGFTTTLSPAAGVALVGLLLCGPIYWPSVFLGAILFLFLNHLVMFQNLSFQNFIYAKIIVALSLTIQALLGVFLVRKSFKDKLELVHPKDIFKFIVISGPVCCLFSSLAAAILLIIFNEVELTEVFSQTLIWWLGQCFGIFIVVPILLSLFCAPKNIWQRRQKLIVWPMSVVCVALIVGFNFFKELEISRIRGSFEKQVESIHQLLDRELYHYVDVLYSMESFYSSSVEVDQQEFKLFTIHHLSKFPGIKVIQWLPVVNSDQRTVFEEKVKLEREFNEFYIFEQNQNGDRKKARQKEEYFPIEYIEPFKDNQGLIGFDVSSQEEYYQTISKSRDLGVPMAATVLNLKNPKQDQRLMVFFPIYKNSLPHNSLDQRRKNLNGFIIGEFMVNDIVKSVTNKFESSKFVLEAYDITRLEPTDLVRSDSSKIVGRNSDKKIYKDYRNFKIVKFFNVAGRRWEVNYSPSDVYIREEQSWNLWFVLIGTVGFTSFLSIFLLLISGRTTEIEELVKEKTNELKSREERFDLAIQGSSEGLWDWVNLEKDDQWWSPRFYGLIGYDPNEIKSSQSAFMGLVHPEDRKNVVEARQNHFEKGENYKVEFRLLHKSGNYRWCKVEGKAYKNEKDQFVRMAGSLVDITTEKNVEAALKEERKKSQDLIATTETALKLKQEFLANVSHEIRSPMNSILGFADLLSKTTLDDKQRNYLETIQSSGKYLVEIMNDLFDFSRMEKGQIRLDSVEFDLEYLISNIVNNISLKLKELPISTYFEIDPHVPKKLVGDASRIRQILMHLLNNAVKFTRQGEISIHVSLAKEIREDDIILKFKIRDTGIGIPKEKQNDIFESFSYAEKSMHRQSEGLGLGLAICRKMIEIMGGQITLKSEQGKGSEFDFTLNLKKSHMPNILASLMLKEELKGKKIFILDNNRKSQEIIYQYCREIGLDIVGSADFAKGALNKIDDLCRTGHVPEIIICEMMMSGMEPEDFVKKIKAQPLCQFVKLISITSNAQPGAARFIQEIGFDAYLSKPISREDIEGVLRVLLSEQTAEGIFVTRHLVKEMSCQGLKILVAEDNLVDTDLIKAFFENLECTGVFVGDGKLAVEKLKEQSFDLCLIDVQMPVMDGIAATKLIRQELKLDVPIIALTAFATKDQQEKCLQSGMNYFLTKPLELNQLREIIIRYGRRKIA